MAQHIVITDKDFAALADASVRTGIPMDELIHRAIVEHVTPAPTSQFGTYLYPGEQPLTAEEEADMERLAQEIGSDHPWPSEMIIEDRGPR